jgi:hypothetical protein
MLLLPSTAWGQDPTIEIQYSSDFGKLWFYTSDVSVTEVKYQWDEGSVSTYTVDTGAEGGISVQAGTITYWADGVDPVSITYYGLIIGETPLSNDNVGANGVVSASNISGSVSFTPANSGNNTPATLSLVNANIQSYAYSAIKWIGNGTLSVQFSGTNTIKMQLNDDASGDNQGFSIQGNSSSTLTLTGADNSSTLTLKPSNSYKKAISGFSTVTIDKDETNDWGMYYTDNFAPATATNLTAGKEVIILKGQPLGLSVAGVLVTDKNKDDILRDGKVSFAPAIIPVDNPSASYTPATLTLNGATISGNIESSISPLTVYLKGNNTINADESVAPFKYTGNDAATLTFDSSEEDKGALTMNGITSIDNISDGYTISGKSDWGFSGNYTDPDWIKECYSDNVRIWRNTQYDLQVGSYHVAESNKNQLEAFLFDSDTYTLSPISSSFDGNIISGLSKLTIEVPGEYTITGTISAKEGTNGKLEIKAGDTDYVHSLTVNNENGAIVGFSKDDVIITSPMNLITPVTPPTTWDENTKSVVISDATYYDLWVEGQQVTSANASDVTGETPDAPTVIYDANKKELTLNGAELCVTEENGIAIESGIDDLTVKLLGTNTISYEGDIAYYAFKGKEGCNITFTTDKNTPGGITINIINAGETIVNNVVSGFEEINYNNGLAPYLNTAVVPVQYIIEKVTLYEPIFYPDYDDEDNSLSVAIDYDVRIGTGFVDPLVYDIYYKIDDGDETKYVEAFPIESPCTITAYTKIGNTSSPVATAKYFGFSEDIEELNVEYDGEAYEIELPVVVPAIASTDGVTLTITESDSHVVNNEDNEEIWMVKGLGEANLTLSIQDTDGTPYTILNNDQTMYLTVKSAPAPPTIGLEEEGLYFTGTVVALTPKVEGVTTKYKWDEGEATVLSTSLTNMPTIPTGTHKLTAWSEYTYNDGNTDVTLKGSEATATYTAGDFDLIIAGNGVDGTTTVTGEGIEGTVTYDKDNKRLTLSGATITGQIECNVAALKVYLVGNSTITPDEDAPFQYTGTDGSLTFESSETDNGELTLNGDYTLSGSTPNITITSGGYTTTTKFDTGLSYTFGDWIIEASKIYYNPHYGITINSYETTKCNKDNITKTSSGGVFSYSPQDKALSIPLDYNGSSTEIKSQRDELNVLISGNSTIRSIVFEKETGSEITSGSLTFKKNSASTAAINKLTIENTTSSGAAINGFSSVSFTAPMKLSVPETAPESWSSSISKAVITDEDIYDLWVEGERVTSGNKDNVKSEGSTPSVKFDPTDNILTLTNANLTVNGKNAIQSGLAKLTVNIVGYSNMIECQGATDAAFMGTSSNNKIVFTSNDPGCITVKNTVDPTKNPINGLEASYENCLGLLYSATNTEYTIETLQAPELQRTGTTDDGITVGLILPSGDKYANSTMYYTIAYKDKTEEDTEYSNAFTMTKPGTVTAYLVSNLGGQSNDEEAKYYGYPDAPYTLAKGKEITPAIYPTIEEDDLIGLNGSTSSDVNIATFTYSDGVVKALATGTVTLTAILTGSDMSFTVLNPKESSEPSNYNYPVTFSVIVGEDLDNMFAANQVFGTYYNTSEDITYKVPEGIKAYIVTGVSGNKVTIAETTVLPPSTPVLLERSNDAIAFTYITATEDDGTLPSGNLLKYASNQVTVPENGKLYILYNGEFVEATAGSIINLKCYLDLNSLNIPAGTRGFGIEGGSNGTTAIDAVSIEEFIVDSDQWYDVQGRRIAKPTKKGLYIKNGKKVVINNK